MPRYDWVDQDLGLGLTSAELTVRAQAVNPNDNGRLLWDIFFPRENVDSVKVENILDFVAKRFVGDRREWNARGRQIPLQTPGAEMIEMVPIETYFEMGEREMQELEERTGGVEARIRELIGVSIQSRIRGLALANYRRLEVDSMSAWTTGEITARNPVTNTTDTVSFGFAAGRIQTAGVAWTGGSGGTAYANFIDWLRDALDEGMSIQGAMMRLATREAIRGSAPNTAFPDSATLTPLLRDVENRIQDEVGSDFRFYLNERTVDNFGDGGLDTTQQKVWPAETIAVVPVGERVGSTAFAPVVRAADVARSVPDAEIDVNGMSVFPEVVNNGRGLIVECQVNALPVPSETNVWVIDAGI